MVLFPSHGGMMLQLIRQVAVPPEVTDAMRWPGRGIFQEGLGWSHPASLASMA